MPFLTVEQLKINEVENNINKEINFTIFDSSTKIKDDQKEKFQYEDSDGRNVVLSRYTH